MIKCLFLLSLNLLASGFIQYSIDTTSLPPLIPLDSQRLISLETSDSIGIILDNEVQEPFQNRDSIVLYKIPKSNNDLYLFAQNHIETKIQLSMISTSKHIHIKAKKIPFQDLYQTGSLKVENLPKGTALKLIGIPVTIYSDTLIPNIKVGRYIYHLDKAKPHNASGYIDIFANTTAKLTFYTYQNPQ